MKVLNPFTQYVIYYSHIEACSVFIYFKDNYLLKIHIVTSTYNEESCTSVIDDVQSNEA